MAKIAFKNKWIFLRDGKSEQEIFLPHDAMQIEGRDPNCISGSANAFFRGGQYTYKNEFIVKENKHYEIHFEGVYGMTTVFINNEETLTNIYGYMPFFLDLDQWIKVGTNTIEIRVDNSRVPNARWYTGSGVYRPITLFETPMDYIKFQGIKITTLSTSPSLIEINIEVKGKGIPTFVILDQEKVVASGGGISSKVEIIDAHLWSDDNPYLYTARVTFNDDIKEVKFGIRKIFWSNQGLFINGKEIWLRGGAIHGDNGILGAVSFEESEYRKVKLMKNAGFNAIRSAHNPANEGLIRACDELGVYLIDEMYDTWFNHKIKYDLASNFFEIYKDDVKKLVDRDFNHPSIIMYSIANEVSEVATPKGMEIAREIIDLFHQYDRSRPTTGGFNLMIISNASKGKQTYNDGDGDPAAKGNSMGKMNSTMYNMIVGMVGNMMQKLTKGKKVGRAIQPICDAVDIAGYNYANARYATEGKDYPHRLIYGSETFPIDIMDNWEMVKKFPWVIGDFMWTAIDYLGESGIGAWAYTDDAKAFSKPYPWLLGDTGAMDILGNPNGEMFLAQVAWGLNQKPLIGVRPVRNDNRKPLKSAWRGTNAIPSWSWKDLDGKQAMVEVFAKGKKALLFINDKKVGAKKIKNGRVIFKTTYEPGQLKTIVIDGQKEDSNTLISAKGNLRLCLIPEDKLTNDDIHYVKIAIVGDNGVIESNAFHRLLASIEGGELLALGSANPRTIDSYMSGSYEAYYGQALAVVKKTNHKTKLCIKVEGLESNTVEF